MCTDHARTCNHNASSLSLHAHDLCSAMHADSKVAKSLEHHSTVRSVFLGGNKIADAGAVAFAKVRA